MIIIKLSEFKISSQDLDQSRTIFIQTSDKIYPVTNLNIQQQKLILNSEPTKKTLTLNQFNQQTLQFDQKLSFYLVHPQELRIFGYRLENNQIIFG